MAHVHRSVRRHTKSSRGVQRAQYIASLLFVVLLVWGFVWVMHHPHITIETSEVRGIVSIEKSEAEQLIEKTLDGNYLFVVPRENSLFYPGNAIETLFLETYPQIEAIQTSLSGTTHLVVSIKERVSNFLWCEKKENEGEVIETCFTLDEDGVVFAEAEVFETENVVYITKEGAPSILLGEVALTEEEFTPIFQFLNKLGTISISRVHITKEDDYVFTTQGGTELRIDKDDSLDEATEHLFSLLNSEEIVDKTVSPSERLNEFMYVDLRFGNKLFYQRNE